MKNLTILQSYINDLRRHISPHLKQGIGLTSVTTPAYGQGAVFEIKLGRDRKNDDFFNTAKPTVNDILKDIPQRLVSKDLNSVTFRGTNISMEPDRLILIKGDDDPDLFSDQGAKHDVDRIVAVFKGGQK
jgi:hypothetical protein